MVLNHKVEVAIKDLHVLRARGIYGRVIKSKYQDTVGLLPLHSIEKK